MVLLPPSTAEDELGRLIAKIPWVTVLSRTQVFLICTQHRLVQFKVVHCVHWAQLELSKQALDVDPLCDRCRCYQCSHVLVLPKVRPLLDIHL